MTASRNDTSPTLLPEPVGEDGFLGDNQTGSGAQDGVRERRPMHDRDDDTTEPGRILSEDERLDEALEETFPTSDPIAPGRIDGPGN